MAIFQQDDVVGASQRDIRCGCKIFNTQAFACVLLKAPLTLHRRWHAVRAGLRRRFQAAVKSILACSSLDEVRPGWQTGNRVPIEHSI
jgi:hypothetical protein